MFFVRYELKPNDEVDNLHMPVEYVAYFKSSHLQSM